MSSKPRDLSVPQRMHWQQLTNAVGDVAALGTNVGRKPEVVVVRFHYLCASATVVERTAATLGIAKGLSSARGEQSYSKARVS